MQPKAQAEMTKFNCEISIAPFVCGTKVGRPLMPHSDLHLHDIQLSRVKISSIFRELTEDEK